MPNATRCQPLASDFRHTKDRQTLLCGRPHVVLKVKVSLSLPGRAGLGASRWRSPTCCQLAYRPTHSVKAGSLHRLVSSLLYRLCLIHSVLSSIICLWTNILLDLDTLQLVSLLISSIPYYKKYFYFFKFNTFLSSLFQSVFLRLRRIFSI